MANTLGSYRTTYCYYSTRGLDDDDQPIRHSITEIVYQQGFIRRDNTLGTTQIFER